MNNKLAKFARKGILAPRSTKGLISTALVSVTKRRYNKDSRCYMRVSLHKQATQRLGWQVGDRIRIDITSSGNISLSPDSRHGKMLSKADGVRTQVVFHVTPAFYNVLPTGKGTAVEIDGAWIIFDLKSAD